MCGICGFVLRQPAAIRDPDASVREMAASLRHRGPDGLESWSDGRVFLGHTRLVVIDRAGGHQPMVSGRTGCVLLFNGEIYNYRDLRRELEARGRHFTTDSDTEVLLQAYEEYGPSCVERFNGMFAVALWDPRRQALFVARDRLGKKPLYYCETSGFFAFASEPKALLRLAAVRASARPDVRALSDFLSLGYILSPKSAFETIKRVPAASWAYIVDGQGQPKFTDYWPVHERYCATDSRPPAEHLGQFGALLEDAVALRSHADVPVGIYLSSGIDSAAVAAVAARVATQPIAFCVSFPDRSYDESHGAKITADHLSIPLVTLRAESEQSSGAAGLVAVTDEPFADTSLIPSLMLNHVARSRITVALSGDGADELLAGYPTYLADRLYAVYRHFPGIVQRGLDACARALLRPSYRKVSFDYKARKFLGAGGLDRKRAHYWWRTIFSESEKRQLMHPDLIAACGDYDPYQTFEARFEEVREADFLSQCLYVDLKTLLHDDILFKVDRASMASGLEVRSPFLDYRLVEFAAALPANETFGWLRGKRILRSYLKDKLPRAVWNGRKRGFNAPTHQFGLLGAPRAAQVRWIRPDFRPDPQREDVTFKALALGTLDAFAAAMAAV